MQDFVGFLGLGLRVLGFGLRVLGIYTVSAKLGFQRFRRAS